MCQWLNKRNYSIVSTIFSLYLFVCLIFYFFSVWFPVFTGSESVASVRRNIKTSRLRQAAQQKPSPQSLCFGFVGIQSSKALSLLSVVERLRFSLALRFQATSARSCCKFMLQRLSSHLSLPSPSHFCLLGRPMFALSLCCSVFLPVQSFAFRDRDTSLLGSWISCARNWRACN